MKSLPSLIILAKKSESWVIKENNRVIARIKLNEVMCLAKHSERGSLGKFTLKDEDII